MNLQRIVRQTAGDGESAQKSEPKAPSGREESSWVVTAGAVDITETALTYQDSSRTPALDAGLGDIMVTLSAEVDAAASETKVRLKGISVAAKKIHAGLLGSPMGFKADIKINAGGSVTAAGTIYPSGPTVESRIDVAGVVLTPLQPYIEPVAKLEMHSGELSSQGTLRYGMKDVGADLAYDGGLNLAKLRLTESGSKDTLEKDEDKAAQSAVQPPQTKKAADPGELSKAIYARLADSEPLPATVLTELAEARARAIVAVLTGDGAVAPARLSTKPSGPLPKDAPVTAKLSLVVSRKSS